MTATERILMIIAVAVSAFGLGMLVAGCTDDRWELVANCANTQAQHVNDQLCCYDARTGAPLRCKAWASETADQACAYCEGR